MTAFGGMPVRTEGSDPALGGTARAVLAEIATLVRHFAATGDTGAIDLRSLPFLPGELAALDAALGTGEVRATVEAMGSSDVRETRFPGVWRITHRGQAGDVCAEFVEICLVPDLLQSDAEAVAESGDAIDLTLAGVPVTRRSDSPV